MTINTQIKHFIKKKIKIKLTLKFLSSFFFTYKVQKKKDVKLRHNSERERERGKNDLLASCRICKGPKNYLYIEFVMKV